MQVEFWEMRVMESEDIYAVIIVVMRKKWRKWNEVPTHVALPCSSPANSLIGNLCAQDG